jgi:hypothetical protein
VPASPRRGVERTLSVTHTHTHTRTETWRIPLGTRVRSMMRCALILRSLIASMLTRISGQSAFVACMRSVVLYADAPDAAVSPCACAALCIMVARCAHVAWAVTCTHWWTRRQRSSSTRLPCCAEPIAVRTVRPSLLPYLLRWHRGLVGHCCCRRQHPRSDAGCSVL